MPGGGSQPIFFLSLSCSLRTVSLRAESSSGSGQVGRGKSLVLEQRRASHSQSQSVRERSDHSLPLSEHGWRQGGREEAGHAGQQRVPVKRSFYHKDERGLAAAPRGAALPRAVRCWNRLQGKRRAEPDSRPGGPPRPPDTL